MQSCTATTTGSGNHTAPLRWPPANSPLAYKLDLTHPSILGVAQKSSEKAGGRNEWKVLEVPPAALHVLTVRGCALGAYVRGQGR